MATKTPSQHSEVVTSHVILSNNLVSPTTSVRSPLRYRRNKLFLYYSSTPQRFVAVHLNLIPFSPTLIQSMFDIIKKEPGISCSNRGVFLFIYLWLLILRNWMFIYNRCTLEAEAFVLHEHEALFMNSEFRTNCIEYGWCAFARGGIDGDVFGSILLWEA